MPPERLSFRTPLRDSFGNRQVDPKRVRSRARRGSSPSARAADLIAAATKERQVVTCTACGAELAVRDEPAITRDLAEIAGLTGAIDFFREVTCPECGALVKVRPQSPLS